MKAHKLMKPPETRVRKVEFNKEMHEDKPEMDYTKISFKYETPKASTNDPSILAVEQKSIAKRIQKQHRTRSHDA